MRMNENRRLGFHLLTCRLNINELLEVVLQCLVQDRVNVKISCKDPRFVTAANDILPFLVSLSSVGLTVGINLLRKR